MKTFAALAVAAFTIAAGQPPATPPLAGVAPEESTIQALPLTKFEKGKGDVLFVRDRTDHWYRVALNDGCLRGGRDADRLDLDPSHRVGGLRRNDTLVLADDGLRRSCRIDSIRRSEAPPQVDSKSPVTLD